MSSLENHNLPEY